MKNLPQRSFKSNRINLCKKILFAKDYMKNFMHACDLLNLRVYNT